jgi:multidrug efflux system membrane fusion protein
VTFSPRFTLTPLQVRLILASFAAVGCSEAPRSAQQSVPVTVVRAEQRNVPFEITAPGSVEPLQAVAVTAQVSGLVTAVRFREGEDVREGQVLVEIDRRPYENALRQAEATLARDLSQLANARRQVERYKGLAVNEYVTSEQFEALETAAAALEATVKSDSAAVDNARLDLEYTTIRSPIAGRTGSLLIKEGNVVRAQAAGPLVLVNQIRPILVRFAVPAGHLPLIRRHQAGGLVVRARLATDSTDLLGDLSFVDNAVDTTTGTILLKGRFLNPQGGLWPGQFVTATLVLYEERDVVVVPAPAVIDGESGPYVFVIKDDRTAETRPVTVGRAVGEAVILTGGVRPGETVVVDGQLRLTPGAKVEPRPLAPAAGENP